MMLSTFPRAHNSRCMMRRPAWMHDCKLQTNTEMCNNNDTRCRRVIWFEPVVALHALLYVAETWQQTDLILLHGCQSLTSSWQADQPFQWNRPSSTVLARVPVSMFTMDRVQLFQNRPAKLQTLFAEFCLAPKTQSIQIWLQLTLVHTKSVAPIGSICAPDICIRAMGAAQEWCKYLAAH